MPRMLLNILNSFVINNSTTIGVSRRPVRRLRSQDHRTQDRSHRTKADCL